MDSGERTAVSNLLRMTALQMALLFQAGSRIEQLIGSHVHSRMSAHDKIMLQELDYMVQTLGELTKFFDSISSQSDNISQLSIDSAAEDIRLRALADAFHSRISSANHEDRGGSSGDVDFFA